MSWYAAHVVLLIHFKDGVQSVFPAWENIYLIDAQTEDEAVSKAEALGRNDEGDSGGTFTWDGRPAEFRSCGLRKLVSVSNSASADNNVGDGAELSYLTLEFESSKALADYMNGTPINLRVLD